MKKDTTATKERKAHSRPTANPPTREDEERAARRAAHVLAIAKFGKGKLPINPATGKRWINTGKCPGKRGTRSPILPRKDAAPMVSYEGRYRNRRERAAELRQRMAQFSEIYNAGWWLREAFFASDKRRENAVLRFLAAMLDALRASDDYEALIYAIAETIMISPHGVPWEE